MGTERDIDTDEVERERELSINEGVEREISIDGRQK